MQADRDVNQHPFPFFTLLPVSHSKSGAPLRQQKKKRALRKRTGRHRRRAEAADRRKQQPPQEADFFPEKSDEIRYPKRNRVCLCPVVHSGEISPFCSSSKGNFWGHVRTSIPVTRVSSFSHFGALPWQRAAPNSKFFLKKWTKKKLPIQNFHHLMVAVETRGAKFKFFKKVERRQCGDLTRNSIGFAFYVEKNDDESVRLFLMSP